MSDLNKLFPGAFARVREITVRIAFDRRVRRDDKALLARIDEFLGR